MLRLAETHRKAVLSHAQRSYPDECCGILLGAKWQKDLEVRAIVACTNQALRKTSRYQIPPRDLLCAQRLARAAGHTIVGFYHSHPDHPAVPSARDIDEALWTDTAYLIVSVRKAIATEMRAFRCVLEGGTRRLIEEQTGVAEAAAVR